MFVLSFEFGSTVLGSTFETAAVLSSCYCLAKFIWVRHGGSTKFGTGLKAAFLWGDPDPHQWSKICLNHAAAKEPVNPLWSWIHLFLWCTMIQSHLGSLIRIRITPKERSLIALLFHAITWNEQVLRSLENANGDDWLIFRISHLELRAGITLLSLSGLLDRLVECTHLDDFKIRW